MTDPLDAQEQERWDIIVPFELSGDELFDRNGEYVPLEQARQAEQAARKKDRDKVIQLLVDYGYGKPVTMDLLKSVLALSEES